MEITGYDMSREGFRKYYSYSLYDLIVDEMKFYDNKRQALINAKRRLRMYANLFCRDMRKFLTSNSKCAECNSNYNLSKSKGASRWNT